MTRASILAEAIKRQLAQHGFHVPDVVIRDVSANALMSLDGFDAEPSTAERPQCWRPTDDGGCWDFTEVQP